MFYIHFSMIIWQIDKDIIRLPFIARLKPALNVQIDQCEELLGRAHQMLPEELMWWSTARGVELVVDMKRLDRVEEGVIHAIADVGRVCGFREVAFKDEAFSQGGDRWRGGVELDGCGGDARP